MREREREYFVCEIATKCPKQERIEFHNTNSIYQYVLASPEWILENCLWAVCFDAKTITILN
jgi:hypothetical protein